MRRTSFDGGYDFRRFMKRDLASRVEEFYNKCHAEDSGQFCSGSSGTVDPISNFEGVFDPAGLMESNPDVQAAGNLAFAAISSVHSYPADLPGVIAKPDDGEFLGSDGGSLGAYMPPEGGPESGLDRGRVVFRAVGLDKAQMASTLIHELGHHLSLGGGVERFHEELKKDGALYDWFNTVKESRAYNELQDVREELPPGDSDGRGYVDYLSMPEELFARSYFQYIAQKTKSRELLGNVVEQMNDQATLGLTQWSPEDFKPIYSAMDRFLKERGLLK